MNRVTLHTPHRQKIQVQLMKLLCDSDRSMIYILIVKQSYYFMIDGEPELYTMAQQYENWVKEMKSEIKEIEKNKTWKLVDLPPSRQPIGVKWVYKSKKRFRR